MSIDIISINTIIVVSRVNAANVYEGNILYEIKQINRSRLYPSVRHTMSYCNVIITRITIIRSYMKLNTTHNSIQSRSCHVDFKLKKDDKSIYADPTKKSNKNDIIIPIALVK